MKKSLLALAVLGAFAGAASAQSSVTLFGVVNMSGNVVRNGSTSIKTLDGGAGQYELASNRLGFRGVEDLGGGMTAGFWLEAGLNSDTGDAGGGGTQLFNRRSTVSLMGKFGEVRLGRDYTPSFWNTAYYDAYGANGFGAMLYMALSSFGSGATTVVRANNMVSYFLPGDLGGLSGQLSVAAGEGVSGGKYKGARLAYAAGPLNVGVAYAVTSIVAGAPVGTSFAPTGNDFKMMNAGASYNLGVATLFGVWNRSEYGSLKQNTYEVSASVPVGAGEIRGSYTRAAASVANSSANKFGFEYIYNLSKRTALYSQVARITNDSNGKFALGGVGMVAGATSTGFGAGLKHSF